MPFISLLFTLTLILLVKADTEIQNVGTASKDEGSYQTLTDESFARYTRIIPTESPLLVV